MPSRQPTLAASFGSRLPPRPPCLDPTASLPDAQIKMYTNAVPPSLCDFKELRKLDWQQRYIKVGGRTLAEGRQTCFYADSRRLRYRYSGTVHENLDPMPPLVDAIRKQVEVVTGHKFNYVLGNLYVDGKSVIMWHSDDVRDLVGPEHLIASVSIGAERKFQFRRIHRTAGHDFETALPSGSVIVMGKGVQERYKHRIVPDHTVKEPRYNFTFRQVRNG
jgi:alkylated DNA repair dioxygenase AlkB